MIKDGTGRRRSRRPPYPYSRANLNAVTGTSVAGFAGTPTGRGWYQDGAERAARRSTRDVYADVNVVVYALFEAVVGSVPRRAVVDAVRARPDHRQFGAPVRAAASSPVSTSAAASPAWR